MDAPKEIYLQWSGEEDEIYITWCEDNINEDDVKYIRYDLVCAYYEGYARGTG